ncbi:MAG: hypothetical protein WAM85_19915 [Terracidiphilus sp.]
MYQECRHIMTNGTKCRSYALKDKPYCYFHTRLHQQVMGQNISAKEPLYLPVLEDRSAIQLALSQVLNALGSSRLDTRHARLFLYGLQIASQNVERHSDIVPRYSVDSVSSTSDGEELGPEICICEPPDECPSCDRRATCEDCGFDEEGEMRN